MKAADSATFCLEDPRGAIGKASPVESVILEILLCQAVDLSHMINKLRDAVEAENKIDEPSRTSEYLGSNT